MSSSERNDVFDAPDASQAATRLGKTATPAPARERILDPEKVNITPGGARRRSLIGPRKSPVESGSPLADDERSPLAPPPAVISPLPAHVAAGSEVEPALTPPGPPPAPATAVPVPETASAEAIAAVVAPRLTKGDEVLGLSRQTSGDDLHISPLQTPSGRTPAPADVNGAWDPDPLSEEVPRRRSPTPLLIGLAVAGGLVAILLFALFVSGILGGAATAVVVAAPSPVVEVPVEVKVTPVVSEPIEAVAVEAPPVEVPVPAAQADNVNIKAAKAPPPEKFVPRPQKFVPQPAVIKSGEPGSANPRPDVKAETKPEVEASPWDVPK